MKEFIRRTVAEVSAIDTATGETFKVNGSVEEISKYYSIKNITSRINSMDLFTIMENICKSGKDIHIINHITYELDKENEFRTSNVSKLAKELDISRVKLSTIFKKLTEVKFMYKLNTGIYFINPFIFIGRRVRSNEKREKLQLKWNDLINE